jgi:hypothetical protein
MRIFFGFLLGALLTNAAVAQHDQSEHERHMAEVKKHGAEAMGFDQDKTTHHFRLYKDGGGVEVQANDAADNASTEHIRAHLQEQATKFAAGDFSAPHHTHSQLPPGAATMKKLRSRIRYEYQPLDRGGRLRITTRDPQALAAVHDFLRFQIEDHATGDRTTVE